MFDQKWLLLLELRSKNNIKSYITVEYPGRTAILTINRPQKLGAVTKKRVLPLTKRLREIDTHDEVFITILTGTRRFFSAETVAHTLNSTEAFYAHSKILVTALDGPGVGIAAALISFVDFVFCAPHTYLLTPFFTSLGLIDEGSALVGFVRRMGVSKAMGALLKSRKIWQMTFWRGDEKLRERLVAHVDDILEEHLVGSILLETKKPLVLVMKRQVDLSLMAELIGGVEEAGVGDSAERV
ncbi:hypothetical protein COCVIDRAFT_41188 [Bipolaris victoriae FI3]|uniref:Enoyl-CoA hydratase n=1 Tax=Bipolaris victoriae (strain FI3) TaxID=930091 RepID=W7EB09_BIPV3|nr:hypothetical protein COCVIDRAFT_41188 [Bipolaris victoriae FI3]